MKEIRANIIECMKECVETFCNECCAGPMIYDDMASLSRWCNEKCPFLKMFSVEKGENDENTTFYNKGKE